MRERMITRALPGLVAAAGLVLASGASHAQEEVTLTIHHFLGPESPAHQAFMQPWAETLSEESDGRIDVEIFPSMSMGGAPPELYSQVRDGFADIVWTVLGYTPGVFPRTEVFELPTVHQGDAVATNLAIRDMMDQLSGDFEDITPLLVHVHAGNALHMVDQDVTSVEDVQGIRLRTPSRTGGWMIEAWGAEPVGMPIPALPQALSRGTVDGALVPFEVVPSLNVQELTEFHIEGQDNYRFGTAVFLFAMNTDRYESLPGDLRQVIDNTTGEDFSRRIGEVWMEQEEVGKNLVREAGNEIIELNASQTEAFNDRGQEVVDRWIEQADSNGLDGEALVENARSMIEQHSSGM